MLDKCIRLEQATRNSALQEAEHHKVSTTGASTKGAYLVLYPYSGLFRQRCRAQPIVSEHFAFSVPDVQWWQPSPAPIHRRQLGTCIRFLRMLRVLEQRTLEGAELREAAVGKDEVSVVVGLDAV